MASASDHIDHVKTQLPYALIGGAITVIMYLVIGFMG
jgi:Na+/H+ antiporter NhaC